MMSRGRSATVALALSLALLLSLAGQCHGQLKHGFYLNKCKSTTTKTGNPFFDFFNPPKTTPAQNVDVEKEVARLVEEAMKNKLIDAAALLRMQFHDCFVEGCDASILINGTNSEKTAGPNFSVRGYQFIESVKAFFERKCKQVVSCADIIVLATKEAVSIASDGRVNYSVRTGRRDGTVSLASNVNLPSSTIKVEDSIKVFGDKKLSPADMVLLIGAHTVGITHCNFVGDRINKTSPAFDRNMNSALRTKLINECFDKNNNVRGSVPVNLDQATPDRIDRLFYSELMAGRGILQIDQDLASHSSTRDTVRKLASGKLDFSLEFAKAMIKLGEITNPRNGNIRSVCGSIN